MQLLRPSPILVLSSLLALAASQEEQAWPILNAHFAIPEANGFFPQPRMVSELGPEWEVLSGCGAFTDTIAAVTRYGVPDRPDLVLMFDANGFIAGVQTVVPESATENDEHFPFSDSPWYQSGDYFGQPAYFVTAYFVDPGVTLADCDSGRTQEDFDEQGTGYAIFFQSGPSPQDLMPIPLTQSEMDAQYEGTWYEHNCFTNMGVHYFSFNYQPDQDCSETIPFQVVYDLNGELNGMVHQHFANLETELYEEVTEVAAFSIIQSPPICVINAILDPGVSSMHIYVRDYHIDC